jgi:hypothetical protein
MPPASKELSGAQWVARFPDVYLSSIGCLNPTKPLRHQDSMDYFVSRARVIALIDSLHAFNPEAFSNGHSRHIVGASVVIDGEPTEPFPDQLPADAPLIS